MKDEGHNDDCLCNFSCGVAWGGQLSNAKHEKKCKILHQGLFVEMQTDTLISLGRPGKHVNINFVESLM